jgi:hypothetical protein
MRIKNRAAQIVLDPQATRGVFNFKLNFDDKSHFDAACRI